MLVTGAPGAGKSTLALPLAAELRFPLLTKDHIEETLHDSRCPEAVLEANFLPHQPERALTSIPWPRRSSRSIARVLRWRPPAATPSERPRPTRFHVIRELPPEVLA
ncbi:hypothetical protein AB0D34_03985 [Streptomyces sp. NPDC048420]|uniref:hypothetical protein n=1 Tax=Streptomyces sp. NPDC048420 TaxID=3155755 RepID=UPI00342ACCFB